MKKIITVVGSSNIDMIMKMDRLPSLGETVTDADYLQTFGGKGANQAVSAARAGGEVYFVNCVGDDVFVKVMLQNFMEDGIHDDFIFHETGIASGTALVMIDSLGHNYLSVAPGANYRLSPSLIHNAEKSIRDAEIIIIQNEIPEETNAAVLDLAEKWNKKVMYNFAPAKSIKKQFWNKIWMLIVNETEAAFLSGLKVETAEDIIHAAKLLSGNGAENVIITLGSKGSYIHSPRLSGFIPAFPIKPVDTTGAGDTYCGSLAVAIAEGMELHDAIRFASAASAISVTRLGAQPSVPIRSEIDEFLKLHRNEG